MFFLRTPAPTLSSESSLLNLTELPARFLAWRTQAGGPSSTGVMGELRRALAAEHLYDTVARSRARPQDASDAVYGAFYGERRKSKPRSRYIQPNKP